MRSLHTIHRYHRVMSIFRRFLALFWIPIVLYGVAWTTHSAHVRTKKQKMRNWKMGSAGLSYTLTNQANSTTVTSQKARYLSDESIVLEGPVTLQQSDGASFFSKDVRLLPDKKSLIGRSPLKGEGPFGNIVAERFSLHEGGNFLVCEGKTVLVLDDL